MSKIFGSLFNSLNMTEEGRLLLEKTREHFPNTLTRAKKVVFRQIHEEFPNVDKDKDIEKLREECYEVVATILAGSKGIALEDPEGHTIVQSALPALFLVEAIVAIALATEFQHVNETEIISRTIHTQMHSGGFIAMLLEGIRKLAINLEEEHIDKIQVKH